MSKVALVAGGHARFGKRASTWRELVQEAGADLFNQVDLAPKEVDSLFVGAAMPERFAFQSHVAPLVAEQLGIRPWKVVTRTELACASGQSALRSAYASIKAGLSEVCLVVGAEKMYMPNLAETHATMACVLDREWDGPHVAPAPPFFAMVAKRHMHEFGTTEEQMAAVSQKNHAYSVHNQNAHFQKPFAMEKILGSRMISSPLKLLDCSPISDGAAAAILTTEERARQLTDVYATIEGSGQSTGGHNLSNLESLTTWEPLKRAKQEAFGSARISLEDLDVAEVHDCFSISEIVISEDLGLAEKGKGGEFAADGQGRIGGKLPLNTRGGLLGCGHPLGATGISQAIAMLDQFRGELHQERQVPGAKLGMTHNLSGSANVHSMLIWGRGG